MKDMYDNFVVFFVFELEYWIIYEEKKESEFIVFGFYGGRIESGVSELVWVFFD